MEKIGQILKDYFRTKPIHKAYLFGSMARRQDDINSDVDILVELDYENGADYFIFFKMQEQLSNLLNKKVDLVSAAGLSKYIKPIIDKEKMLIYERKNS